MNHRAVPFTLALCGLVGLSNVAAAQTTRPAEMNIDPETTFQTIDGFGASGAWWAQGVGAWPEQKRAEIVDLLYGPDGAALDIYRHNLGGVQGTPENPSDDSIPDPWRRPFTIEVAPGEYDIGRDAAALQILQDVRERGVEHFVLFANSPPADLTISGMTSGGHEGRSNLAEENEAAFAERFVATAVAIAENYDLPHVVLSPINEPNVSWGRDRRHQEGSSYPPEQAARILAKVAAAMEAAGLSPERYTLDGPESTTWADTRLFRAVLEKRQEDPILRKWLSQLATHSYGGNNRQRRELVELRDELAPGLPIAMTEWTEMQSGQDGSIETAITMSNKMHDDLNVGQAVSWQKWIGVSKYDWRDGLIYVEPEEQTYRETKRLWGMAQWSRFVPEGSVRIAVEDGDDRVRSSAFRRPDGTLAIVLTNRADEAITLSLPDASEGQAWKATVTDAERNLAPLPLADDTVEVPARSIVTLVSQ